MGYIRIVYVVGLIAMIVLSIYIIITLFPLVVEGGTP